MIHAPEPPDLVDALGRPLREESDIDALSRVVRRDGPKKPPQVFTTRATAARFEESTGRPIANPVFLDFEDEQTLPVHSLLLTRKQLESPAGAFLIKHIADLSRSARNGTGRRSRGGRLVATELAIVSALSLVVYAPVESETFFAFMASWAALKFVILPVAEVIGDTVIAAVKGVARG